MNRGDHTSPLNVNSLLRYQYAHWAMSETHTGSAEVPYANTWIIYGLHVAMLANLVWLDYSFALFDVCVTLQIVCGLRTERVFETALALNLSWYKGNYVRTLRLIRQLPLLHLWATHRHIDSIRGLVSPVLINRTWFMCVYPLYGIIVVCINTCVCICLSLCVFIYICDAKPVACRFLDIELETHIG